MDNHKKGIMLIVASSLFFSMMALFVKYTGDYPVYEKMFFRGIVAILVIGSQMLMKKESFVPGNLKLNMLRSTLGAMGVLMYYFALSRLVLSDAVILNKLSPFFVILFSSMFIGERIKRFQVLSMIVAFAGALLIIKPSFDSSVLPSIIGLLSAAAAGGAYVAVRELRKYDRPKVIVFFFSLYTTVLSIPLMVIFGFVMPKATDLIFLILIGVCAMIAQLFMTKAYEAEEASKISIYSYANIVFSIIFSILIFGENPDILSLFGLALVFMGAFNNFYWTRRKS